ncbi:hypothetical protein AVEN_77256-1 [Araneus ventricosus]|uniref:Uncharacterized protein n=1 Tax=Araneus ventricosus TaxID=182803 RepID=A0A4Y2U647_ARAVE|nr:hypothetical protein AVEN_86906-1 [Araneus ventricosus]GBO07156.1 hypothetical protein AVEN_77256-1 [Araneus ventricosus]
MLALLFHGTFSFKLSAIEAIKNGYCGNRIRPEILTSEQIWVQQTFDEKPICLSLTEVELKGKFDQLKTKSAVVEADKGKYLLGNSTAALLGKDRECLLFPKAYVLQTRSQKREAEQNRETGQLRNTFSKEINTKEVGKFRSSKVLANYVSTPRNSDITAKTNETVNQLKTINKRKKFQSSKFPEVQSPAVSTCASVNDTKIKSVTKILKRPNKYSFSVNAIEGLTSCTRKSFQKKREIIEDAEFGSEPEKEHQTSFRENKLTEKDELISDYEIPVSANRLNDSAQKKSNTDSSETEISYKSHLSSVNTENDESLIEMRIEKEDMAELMQLKKEDLLFDVKTVPYALVSDAEDTRRKSLNSQTAENLATENIVRKYELWIPQKLFRMKMEQLGMNPMLILRISAYHMNYTGLSHSLITVNHHIQPQQSVNRRKKLNI